MLLSNWTSTDWNMAMSCNGGYVKLYRSLKNWRYKKKPNYVALWVHLIEEANHKSKLVEDVFVSRGSLLTSYGRLADETGLSVQQVRSILQNLNGNELILKSTNKYTLISIVKYDFFQGDEVKTNKQITSKQQTNNNKQERKEGKKEKNIYTDIPIYDPSTNRKMTDEEEAELLEIMGRA